MLRCDKPVMLTQAEIKELTGETNKNDQIKELKALGYPCQPNKKGWPIVSRKVAEQVIAAHRVVGALSSTTGGSNVAEPDWNQMKAS